MSDKQVVQVPQYHDSVVAEAQMFELRQRRAAIYSQSTLVPKHYQGSVGNVLIAENMANRMGADVLMVMQNLYIVHGNPGWSASFLIACFNQCGRFSSIKYRFTGTKGKDDWGCIAYATELETGELVEGTEITLKIAKDEGWYEKSGSKWKTIPEQMLRYRAATFLIRATAPEIGMGLQTRDELSDVGPVIEGSSVPTSETTSLSAITNEIESAQAADEPEPEVTPQSIVDEYVERIKSADSEEDVGDLFGMIDQEFQDMKIPASERKALFGVVDAAMRSRIDEIKGGS